MFGHAWRIGLPGRTRIRTFGLGLVRCRSLSDWLLPCLLLHCSLCVQLLDQAGKANNCSVSDLGRKLLNELLFVLTPARRRAPEQLFAFSCWMGSPVLLKRMIVRSRRHSSDKLLRSSILTNYCSL